MAQNFIAGGDIDDWVVLFGGEPITGFVKDGTTRAVDSALLREAGEPVEGSGGFWCAGEDGSQIEVITLTVLRGSPGDNLLAGNLGPQNVDTFSATPRGLPVGVANSRFFSNCAYVAGTSRGPIIGGDKTREYTIYAQRPINNDLNVI